MSMRNSVTDSPDDALEGLGDAMAELLLRRWLDAQAGIEAERPDADQPNGPAIADGITEATNIDGRRTHP